MGRLAIEVGLPKIVSLDELGDEATLITVSAVGAPAAEAKFARPVHYVRAVQLLVEGGLEVQGLITSENGGLASLNGWFQSAILGIPVVDAPCNGRAHPIGVMGSIGLHNVSGYLSRQAAAGGNPGAARYVEVRVSAGLVEAARIVRQAAVSAGGMVAVARNPVTADYARDNAAVGALTRAIELGGVLADAMEKTPGSTAEKAAEALGGRVVARGTVAEVTLRTEGGFDVRVVVVKTEKASYELTFWNEYMTLESDGERLGTFPDLMATLDAGSGAALTTAAIRRGQQVAVLHVPADRLILGAGMKDPEVYREVERILDRPILPYAFPDSK
jgi:DUF917 family protein